MEELKDHTKYGGYYEQGHIEYSYTMNMFAVALLYTTASYSRPSENRKSGTEPRPVTTRLNQQHLQLDNMDHKAKHGPLDAVPEPQPMPLYATHNRVGHFGGRQLAVYFLRATKIGAYLPSPELKQTY